MAGSPLLDEPQFTSSPSLINTMTDNANIDGILGETRFRDLNLTFAFPQTTADYESNYAEFDKGILTFVPITESMKAANRFAFQTAASFSGLTFTEVSTPLTATLRVGLFTPSPNNEQAYAFLPTTSINGGDSWYPNTVSFTVAPRGTYGWLTILHEIGHNLGLDHGHESGGVAGSPMNTDRDSTEFSIMTYRSFIGGSFSGGAGNQDNSYAQTFMMYDIAAIQTMYGANFTTNGTDSVYTFSATTGEQFINGVGEGVPTGGADARIYQTIWDGGGNDTYDFSNYSNAMNVDLRAGFWSKFSNAQTADLGAGNFARGNVYNALQFRGDARSLIENAVGGAGNDALTGNQANNRLVGGAGNDSLDGGSGDDNLLGGDGDDTLVGDFATLVQTIGTSGVGSSEPSSRSFAQGTMSINQADALNITNAFSLDSNANIEASTTNFHTSVSAIGNGAAHWYRLDVASANVRISIDIDSTTQDFNSNVRLGILNANGGFTLLRTNDDSQTNAGALGSTSSLDSYMRYTTLAAGTYFFIVGTSGAQNALAQGAGYTVHASVFGQTVTVGTHDNGVAGNDTLNGGAGNDSLSGMLGSDLLIGGEGVDTLLGGEGIDTLDGGLGMDILDGGAGFDFATYANATAGLTLFMGGGTFNSGEANGDAHTSIEGLIGSQFSDIIGGDAGINELRGLNGNDFIYGRGGIDTLLGGDGNDVLDGGTEADVLTGGTGLDVAYFRDATSAVTASLLTGGSAGEAAGDTYFEIENIWGSRFDDVLAGDNNGGQVYGFEGNDNLSGLGGDDFFYGGTGSDTIVGGDGLDSAFFLSWNDHVNQFGTPEPYEGGDVFQDFVSGTDRIILSRFWFGFGNIGGPAASLTETHANFVTDNNTATARPSLIWNNTTRTLSFDADGNGATAAVLLGTFQQGAALSLGDIWTA